LHYGILFFFRSRVHIWERTCDMSFSVWLILVSIMIFSSTYFPANDISFFFKAEQYSIV
jgi:hypothetical protein